MTVGMMRNVVPALAESEFGVPRGSLLLLVTFLVADGVRWYVWMLACAMASALRSWPNAMRRWYLARLKLNRLIHTQAIDRDDGQ